MPTPTTAAGLQKCVNNFWANDFFHFIRYKIKRGGIAQIVMTQKQRILATVSGENVDKLPFDGDIERVGRAARIIYRYGKLPIKA